MIISSAKQKAFSKRWSDRHNVGYAARMRIRLSTLILVLCSILPATSARAQISKWDTVRYEKWGIALQVPSGSAKQAIEGQPEGDVCDVYAIGGLACVVRVTPTPATQLSSTVIEQTIQTEMKEASSLGPAKRWEQVSRQGNLFKGFTASVQIKAGDPLQTALGKIVGEQKAFQSTSMAALGDDASPILRIEVIGPKSRQAEVITTAKGIAAFAARLVAGTPSPAPPTPKKPSPGPKPTPKPEPAPVPKPWPSLKEGEIEIVGMVNSISADRRSLVLSADTIKMPGQEAISLTPKRAKKVLLRDKLSALVKGAHIHLIGKNEGVGRPIAADAIEATPSTPSL